MLNFVRIKGFDLDPLHSARKWMWSWPFGVFIFQSAKGLKITVKVKFSCICKYVLQSEKYIFTSLCS